MKMSGTQTTEALTKSFQNNIGRHLYGVLGSYKQLETFLNINVPHIIIPEESIPPKVIHFNNSILDLIGDDDLRDMIKVEARLPQSTQGKLNKVFESLLINSLRQNRVLIIYQMELLFAYEMDLQIFRARATNQNHIVLLLPGELHRDQIDLFNEGLTHAHQILPAQLITENHLWEIQDV